jgi:hypothetical protein
LKYTKANRLSCRRSVSRCDNCTLVPERVVEEPIWLGWRGGAPPCSVLQDFVFTATNPQGTPCRFSILDGTRGISEAIDIYGPH